MSDEFNKGYFSAGPQSTYEAQQGQWARRQDDARDREEANRAAREQQESFDAIMRSSSTAQTWSPGSSTSWSNSSNEPATLAGCVQACAILGAILFACYVFFGKGAASWAALAVIALQGAVAGAVGGVGLYVVIVVLRIAVAILAVVLKWCFYAALLLGGLWFLSRMA